MRILSQQDPRPHPKHSTSKHPLMSLQEPQQWVPALPRPAPKASARRDHQGLTGITVQIFDIIISRVETSFKKDARICSNGRRIFRSKDAESGGQGDRERVREATLWPPSTRPSLTATRGTSTVQIKHSDAVLSGDAGSLNRTAGTWIKIG